MRRRRRRPSTAADAAKIQGHWQPDALQLQCACLQETPVWQKLGIMGYVLELKSPSISEG